MSFQTEPRPLEPQTADAGAVLGAVREDIRQTLRMGWFDPALEEAAAHPVFFSAAWSAIRPNVGKSFFLVARALRGQAAEAIRSSCEVPDLRKQAERLLSEEETRRICETARAAHAATAKTQIVVHALHRMAARGGTEGTGQEEPPIRRGVPEWQRWMSTQHTPEASARTLGLAADALSTPTPPSALRLLARWPPVLESTWAAMEPTVGGDRWAAASARLRRIVAAGVQQLPHPLGLQWTALRHRGLADDERRALAESLRRRDASMPVHTLAAAFAWLAFGAPELGSES